MAHTSSGDDGNAPHAHIDIFSRDKALHAAIRRKAWKRTAKLSLEQVYAHHKLQWFASAREYADLALDACRMAGESEDWRAAIERNALDMSALEHFYLGNYRIASKRIAAAARLAHLAPNEPKFIANIDWTAALIDRWRGKPFHALEHALRALDIYLSLDSPKNAMRLRIVIADIMLDIAMPPTADHREALTTFLDLAATYLAEAIKSDAMSVDQAAARLADLTYVRLSRISGKQEDRIALIERIAQMAEELHDLPLVGQVHTAFGDEFAHRGHIDLAHAHYAKAIELLKKSDAPVLAIWPLRALHKFREMDL